MKQVIRGLNNKKSEKKLKIIKFYKSSLVKNPLDHTTPTLWTSKLTFITQRQVKK